MGGAGELVALAEGAVVLDPQGASGRVDEVDQQAVETAGKYEIAVDGFVVAVEKSWCVPGAPPRALSRVELWVANRGSVFDSRDHGGTKVVCRQRDSRSKHRANDRTL